MVAGRLQEKNGFYYIVLSYTDSAGKRRQPWIGTGLPVKGNKKRAEKMLADTRKDFTIPKGQVSELSPDMAFSDYMRYWLKMMRTAVTETTYSSYCFNVEKHIIPYFEPLGVTLAGLQPRQIQSFYLHEAETLKNTSTSLSEFIKTSWSLDRQESIVERYSICRSYVNTGFSAINFHILGQLVDSS